MKKSKIILTVLATVCTLTLSACNPMQTSKPSNSPFYEDDNKASPVPSDIMPSISPDLEPNNSPGNNPPDLIPNPTENENPNDNLK